MSSAKREIENQFEYGEYCEPQEVYRTTQDVYETEWPSEQEMADDEERS